MADCASYVICTAPRSGSTLLCDLLTATGVAGNPDSHFHEASVEAWRVAHGVAAGLSWRKLLQAVLDAAVAEGSRGGVFGLRVQRARFDFLMARLAEFFPGAGSDRARIEAAFGPVRFVYLRRGDKLEQAVSFEKARQSGLWHAAPDGREIERLSPPAEPVFDRAAIAARMAELAGYDAAWEGWFAREGIAPLRLSYEALAADPGGVLRGVLAHLGCDPAAAQGVVPGLAKLADATSRDWVARFRDGDG